MSSELGYFTFYVCETTKIQRTWVLSLAWYQLVVSPWAWNWRTQGTVIIYSKEQWHADAFFLKKCLSSFRFSWSLTSMGGGYNHCNLILPLETLTFDQNPVGWSSVQGTWLWQWLGSGLSRSQCGSCGSASLPQGVHYFVSQIVLHDAACNNAVTLVGPPVVCYK